MFLFRCPPSIVYYSLPIFLGKVSLGRRDKGEMCSGIKYSIGFRTHLAVNLAGRLKYQEWRVSLRVTEVWGRW